MALCLSVHRQAVDSVPIGGQNLFSGRPTESHDTKKRECCERATADKEVMRTN